MHEVARALLAKLMSAAERREDDGAVVTLPLTARRAPGYLTHNSLAEREAIHAVLSNAQAPGAVQLERIGEHGGPAGELARYWLTSGAAPREQEAQEPVSPVRVR